MDRFRMQITGQCHCGAVGYRAVIDPEAVSICHCTDCQRLTGSAFRLTVRARAQDFTLTGTAPRCYLKHGDSGAKRFQYFCGDCGAPIYTTGEGEAAQIVGIRAGTIDQRAQLVPRSQIWGRSRLPWLEQLNAIPCNDRE
ncbi:GFA family protein [Paracoccus sp. DMF]|uniref:GFA family protein n=1 Tax=Paracoccus sp. DMF TaxID=400837 RepID=UPI0021E3BA95|nr:GFA family protein [Paracoccus sp. DMF]MCV2445774.1 GFA family protein [Paracoccus sp. DMF]